MKHSLKIAVLFLSFAGIVSTAGAQSVSDIISKVKSATSSSSSSSSSSSTSSTASTISSIVDNLIGTSNVSAKSLVGTWKYTEPAVAFESESALSKIGGSVASSSIEDKMATYLSKVGISEGKFSIKFESDGTFTATVNSKSVSGTYTVSGSNITFDKESSASSSSSSTSSTSSSKLSSALSKLKSSSSSDSSSSSGTKISANVKLGTTLQITFEADKLLEFAKQFASAAGSASSTLSTISSLADNYSGMQLGMKFSKK